ncbi:medium-chain acyl-[acyl-carrier-protein] hydrolase [Catenulispora sp. GP43]|uniref:thioesterase II family protein n=1 Tax=Catenulispora sp. GP43 TaxID=3156263 RepID=UPI0035181F45
MSSAPIATSAERHGAALSRAVARLRSEPRPRLRLICFPHVGAGAAVFRTWISHLPPEVDLYAVRAPGRENRVTEPLATNGHVLLEALAPDLEPLLEVPFVIVGHCSGSVLAYEYARMLRAVAGPEPVELVLSSAEGPKVRKLEDPPLHRLGGATLLERVVAYGGMAPQVLDDPQLMSMYERILRADYQAVETLSYSPGPALEIPLTVLGGRRDEFVSPESMAAWSAETTGRFSLRLLDGPHFILAEAGVEIGLIAERLVGGAV